jgi:Flp pilus assembly protein TadG
LTHCHESDATPDVTGLAGAGGTCLAPSERVMPSGARRRGQAVVEAAIVLVVLVALLAGLLDVTRLWMAQQAIQAGARAGARLGATGRRLGGLDREASIKQAVIDEARHGLAASEVVVEHLDAATGSRGAGPGGPNDVVVVRVVHPVALYSPWLAPLLGGSHPARAQAAVRNEDFAVAAATP